MTNIQEYQAYSISKEEREHSKLFSSCFLYSKEEKIFLPSRYNLSSFFSFVKEENINLEELNLIEEIRIGIFIDSITYLSFLDEELRRRVDFNQIREYLEQNDDLRDHIFLHLPYSIARKYYSSSFSFLLRWIEENKDFFTHHSNDEILTINEDSILFTFSEGEIEWYTNKSIKRSSLLVETNKREIKEWYENGKIKSSSSYIIVDENEKKDGLFQQWYENGKWKSIEYYSYGKPVSIHQEWYPSGKEKKEIVYNSKFIVEKGWYEDGSLLHFYSMKNSLFSSVMKGKAEEWYSNGKRKKLYFLKNGLKDGEYREWYPSGKIKIVCAYSKDQYDSWFQELYESGELRRICFFCNGKLFRNTLEEW